MNDVKRIRDYTKLFPAICSSPTLEKAAKAAGMSVSTFRRRIDEPEFISAFAQFSREMRNVAAVEQTAIQAKALKKLDELLESKSEPVKIRAVRLALTLPVDYLEKMELDARLRRLEQEHDSIFGKEE